MSLHLSAKLGPSADSDQGKNCLTSFYGMDFTTDKLRSIVRKWQTLIEAYVDVNTTDGYRLRLFSIGFTKRAANQVKKTTYAQSSQVKAIRGKMTEIMRREAEGSELKELVAKFVPESIGREIEKATKVRICCSTLEPPLTSRVSTHCTTSTSERSRFSELLNSTCRNSSKPTVRLLMPTLDPRSSRAVTLLSQKSWLLSRLEVVLGHVYLWQTSCWVLCRWLGWVGELLSSPYESGSDRCC